MKVGKMYAGIAVGVVAVAAGGWFLFLSPKSSDISAELSATSFAVGEQATVSGSVTPPIADRVVVLERRMDGAWTDVDRSATDAVGEYTFELLMSEKGNGELRTRVLDAGRLSEAASSTIAVKVLDPTLLEAQVSKFARADRAMRIPGRVTPPGKRAVIVETSPDGLTWTQVATATSAAANGKFMARVTGLKPGPVQVRVRVDESASAAEVVGKTARVSVEDYKTAGKRYLEIVKPGNALSRQINGMSDYLDYTAYQDIYAKLSKARTKEAKAFRQYAYWPREVKANIELLAKSDDLSADMYSQLANAKSESAFIAVDVPVEPKGADNAAALIRAALGLPKRE
jgi:hypothetical protein